MDPSGKWPSGEGFSDFASFKETLVATRKDVFTRHLIAEVLSYATGRHIEPVDRFEIDDILGAVRADGYGLRTLIIECLTSEIFRSR